MTQAKPKSKTKSAPKARPQLPKSPTGIQGLDEITGGGLPKGRPTLVCGGPGCGKTLLAMEFLVRGATEFNEPGVFMAFEEAAKDLTQNVASLGFDLKDLVARKKIVLDFVYIERSEIEESGEYDLEGLFIRLGQAIDSIGAKRVVLDTVESLFSGLPNPLILRAELRRLFRWLKDKGVTAIITGERGEGTLTRQGLEEYVSDCVIVLDHRVSEQTSSRRLRVVKYRGSTHGTNESVSDRRRRYFGAAGHVAGIAAHCLQRTCFHRYPAPRRDAGWHRVLPGQQRAGLRHGGHRQEQSRGTFCRRRLRSRRARTLLFL